MAVTIVTIVIDYIAKKLPAPFGTQVKVLLSNDAMISQAEDLLGSFTGNLEKKEDHNEKEKIADCESKREGIKVLPF